MFSIFNVSLAHCQALSFQGGTQYSIADMDIKVMLFLLLGVYYMPLELY